MIAAVTGHPGVALLADSDTGKGSPIGLFVVLVLVIAVYFLYRSMSRHIRKLPETFDRSAAEAPAAKPEEVNPPGPGPARP